MLNIPFKKPKPKFTTFLFKIGYPQIDFSPYFKFFNFCRWEIIDLL